MSKNKGKPSDPSLARDSQTALITDPQNQATEANSPQSEQPDLSPKPGRAPSARFLAAGGKKPTEQSPSAKLLGGASLGDLVMLKVNPPFQNIKGVGGSEIKSGMQTRLSPIHVSHARAGALTIQFKRKLPSMPADPTVNHTGDSQAAATEAV